MEIQHTFPYLSFILCRVISVNFHKIVAIRSNCRVVIISLLKPSHFLCLKKHFVLEVPFCKIRISLNNNPEIASMHAKNKAGERKITFLPPSKQPLVLKTRVGYSGFNTASFRDQTFLLRFFLHGY